MWMRVVTAAGKTGLLATAGARFWLGPSAGGPRRAEAELRCHGSLRHLDAPPAEIDTLLIRSSV
jgi:hypothetical protein